MLLHFQYPWCFESTLAVAVRDRFPVLFSWTSGVCIWRMTSRKRILMLPLLSNTGAAVQWITICIMMKYRDYFLFYFIRSLWKSVLSHVIIFLIYYYGNNLIMRWSDNSPSIKIEVMNKIILLFHLNRHIPMVKTYGGTNSRWIKSAYLIFIFSDTIFWDLQGQLNKLLHPKSLKLLL